MTQTPRSLSLLLAVSALACGGPPPATRTAAPSASAVPDDLRPLSSREAPAAGAAAAGAGPATGALDAATALPPGHPPIGEGTTMPPQAARGAASLAGTIELAPKLGTAPGDVLYVMAKKGPTTLAVQRIEKPSFPLAFELAASDAMVSGVPLEGPVDVVARLSRTGDAIPAKGDLEGITRGVAVPSKRVKVTIDRTRP